MNITFWKTRTFWWYWLPPLAWCLVVVILSGDLGSSNNTLGILKWLLSWLPLKQAQLNQLHVYVRKAFGHFGNYGFLFFLWFRAFREQPGSFPGRAFFWSMILCLAVALIDEGHQALFVTRGSSLWDVALDLSGAATVGLVTVFFWGRRSRWAAGN